MSVINAINRVDKVWVINGRVIGSIAWIHILIYMLKMLVQYSCDLDTHNFLPKLIIDYKTLTKLLMIGRKIPLEIRFEVSEILEERIFMRVIYTFKNPIQFFGF